MVKSKKAQAAMEFLMTYGWAMLVVLVVIGALAYFGVLSPTNLLPEKCFLPIGLNCEQFFISQTSMQFKVRNGLGDKITINSFKVIDDNDVTICSNSQTLAIQNGKAGIIKTLCGISGDVGEKQKYVLELTYYKGSASSFTHTIEGELMGRVEESTGEPIIPEIGDLISYWTFESNADDTAGNNDGTLNGDPQNVIGKVGNAYEFDGIGDFITIAHSDSIDFDITESFTIALWIKFPAAEINPKWSFGKGNVWTGIGYGLANWEELSKPQVPVGFYINDGSYPVGPPPVCDISLNREEWIHLMYILDRPTNILKCYKNGAYINQGDISGYGSFAINEDLIFGAMGASHFSGFLDEILIWNTALSDTEVSDLYTSYS